ncbi:MAG: hydrogen gas-evolving membrane-bound hydrogenase subunit E, partial [Stellaceae bacterium]
TLAMVAAAAMAGVPLLNGFLSKEMFFAETIEIHDNSLVDQALPYLVTIASMFTVAYSLRFIRDVFFGPLPEQLQRTPREPPFLMRFPAELLVLACLVVGILPAMTVGPLLETAARAVLGPAIPKFNLAVWHGFTPELLMSIVAICGGVTVYFMLHSYLLVNEGPPLLRHIKGQRIFERVLVTVSWRLARRLQDFLGTRRLQPQLRLVIGAALLVGFAPIYARGVGFEDSVRTAFDFSFGIIWAIGIACALAAAYQAKFHRLAALVLLGGAGLVTCVSFVWTSAPDLALTQLAVEAVTTVLLLLGLRWLPKRAHRVGHATASSRVARWYRARDLAIAIAAGSGLAALAYMVMTRPAPDSIAQFFVENAYRQGGGTNVVNVILVDFRGFDTFGEITVLGIVALTVYALLRRFRPAVESIPVPEQQRAQDLHDEARSDRQKGDTLKSAMAVPALMMAMLFPVMIVAAIFLLLRGHDQPGGGFVAGIAMAVAFILQYMARGTIWVEARLNILPVRWMGGGLLLAVGVGAAAWLFDRPFLSSSFSYVEIPLIGAVPIASALLFDLGVFALVVGATVLMLIAIAHQSVRSHRAPGSREPNAPAAPPRAEVQ